MRTLNDIYYALNELEGAISKINNTVRGTNDPNHDWCKYARITLARGRAAYAQLEKEYTTGGLF